MKDQKPELEGFLQVTDCEKYKFYKIDFFV